MKDLKQKVLDENLCIGKFDEADQNCRKCSGYEYRRICYCPMGKRSDFKQGERKYSRKC